MPILVDGNNLLHRLARGQRSREEVRRLVLDRTRHERLSVVVVFDGPPPAGSPAREVLGRVTVVYAGAHTADDAIIGRLPRGMRAREYTVVTDDRALARRARDRGAQTRSLEQWRSRPAPKPRRTPHERRLSSREIAEWESFFARDSSTDSDS